jgi:hypothetical protein
MGDCEDEDCEEGEKDEVDTETECDAFVDVFLCLEMDYEDEYFCSFAREKKHDEKIWNCRCLMCQIRR